MEFTSKNYQDIQKYYLNTFVKFREHGDMLFQITGVDKYSVQGTAENGDELRLWLDEEHPYVVDYVLPHKSFFQYNESALQLCRIPAQQYQRGLCNKNTAIYILKGTNDKVALPFSFEILKAFVQKQKFYTLSEAAAGKDKCKTHVLSPRMMFNKSNQNIYIDFLPVAKVNMENKTPTVYVNEKIFRDEVLELLQQTGESLKFQLL